MQDGHSFAANAQRHINIDWPFSLIAASDEPWIHMFAVETAKQEYDAPMHCCNMER